MNDIGVIPTVQAVRDASRDLPEKLIPADPGMLAALGQFVGQRDPVNGAARVAETDHCQKCRLVTVPIEVLWAHACPDLVQAGIVQEDRAEEGLLGLDVMGRRLVGIDRPPGRDERIGRPGAINNVAHRQPPFNQGAKGGAFSRIFLIASSEQPMRRNVLVSARIWPTRCA